MFGVEGSEKLTLKSSSSLLPSALPSVLTWFLHFWAAYTVLVKLLNPWMGPGALPVDKAGDGGGGGGGGDGSSNDLSTHKSYTCFAFHSTCFMLVAAAALVSHGKAMLTDPGAVPEFAVPPGSRDLGRGGERSSSPDSSLETNKLIGEGGQGNDKPDVVNRGASASTGSAGESIVQPKAAPKRANYRVCRRCGPR